MKRDRAREIVQDTMKDRIGFLVDGGLYLPAMRHGQGTIASACPGRNTTTAISTTRRLVLFGHTSASRGRGGDHDRQ